ncbi:MAG: DNA adenine methylase [Vicinamibacterales bacterium]
MTIPSPTTPRSRTTSTVVPLLKWVGGKRQLLPCIRPFYPRTFGTYIEPFFGSGAVFFDLWNAGRLAARRALLIDSNSDLIGCYQMVRQHPARVLRVLGELAEAHARDGRAHYYDVRDRRFNPLRAAARRPDGNVEYTPELAAMLIYLNRTGFNGLYRVNAQGHFNVPAGRYLRPQIADRERLTGVAHVLERATVQLRLGSFDEVLELAAPGDFLYIDPPYAPVSTTASFTAYTARRFDEGDQRRLQQVVIALARRGCWIVVSNSTAPAIAALYDDNAEARRAGLRAYRVLARRAVNSVGAKRGAVDEYLISNVPRTDR